MSLYFPKSYPVNTFPTAITSFNPHRTTTSIRKLNRNQLHRLASSHCINSWSVDMDLIMLCTEEVLFAIALTVIWDRILYYTILTILNNFLLKCASDQTNRRAYFAFRWADIYLHACIQTHTYTLNEGRAAQHQANIAELVVPSSLWNS